MERFRRLRRHWQPDGNRYQPHPPVFYLCVRPYDGIADHYLHGARFLEKHAKICMGGEEKSVVLPVVLLINHY